jgi:hypothetical protein
VRDLGQLDAVRAEAEEAVLGRDVALDVDEAEHAARVPVGGPLDLGDLDTDPLVEHFLDTVSSATHRGGPGAR